MNSKLLPVALILAAIVSTGGCGSLLAPQPDRAQFFVLTSSTGSVTTKAAASNATGKQLSIGVGPVSIPEYLQRPGIATRVGPTRVEYSQTDQWAEPLEQCFPRVLAQDLSNSPAISRVVMYPWPRSIHVDFQLEVNVRRFELDTRRQAVLDAKWDLENPITGKVIESGFISETHPAGSDASTATTALSHVLGSMADSLASRIAALSERLDGNSKIGFAVNGSPAAAATAR